MAIDTTRQLIEQIKNATQVGENTATRVGNAMDSIMDEVDKSPEIGSSDADLTLEDERSFAIAEFRNGHIKTKDFDSSVTSADVASLKTQAANAPSSETYTDADFAIADENENIIMRCANGHIQTKYFNSADIITIENPYNGKILSILGDSISTFGVPDQNNATGTWTYPGNRCRYPQSNLFTDVKYQYWYRLIEKLGMNLGINESWAGSLVSNTQATDSGDKGPNRCMSSLTRIGHLGNNGNPDLIIVYGGTNDAGAGVTVGTFNTENPKDYTEQQIAALSVATFADAYRAMLIRLQYYYPLAKIVCCFPNYTSSYYTITNLDAYEEIIREACDFFGVEFIDLRTVGVNIYNTETYLPDGIHPNANGMKLIYDKIFKHLVYG